jgi:hypothetical protein
LARLGAAHVDMALVRVAHKTVSPPFALAVQPVQEQVRPQGGDSGPPGGVPCALGYATPPISTPALR